MIINFNIPEYDGGWIDVFWEDNARFQAEILDNRILISGNAEAFFCFAKQMMYFCFNNVPVGTHAHYDNFFCKANCLGMEFVIGLLGDRDSGMWCSGDFTGEIAIEVPNSTDGVVWNMGAEAAAQHKCGQISLEGNRIALYAIAKQLLSFSSINSVEKGHVANQYSHRLMGWTGEALEFRLITKNEKEG